MPRHGPAALVGAGVDEPDRVEVERVVADVTVQGDSPAAASGGCAYQRACGSAERGMVAWVPSAGPPSWMRVIWRPGGP